MFNEIPLPMLTKRSSYCDSNTCVEVGIDTFKQADCEGGACVQVSGIPAGPPPKGVTQWWRTDDGGFQIRQGDQVQTYDAAEYEAFKKGVLGGEFTRGMMMAFAVRQGWRP